MYVMMRMGKVKWTFENFKTRKHNSCQKLTNNSFITVETIDDEESFKITWTDYKIHPEYDNITERFTHSNPRIWGPDDTSKNPLN